MISNMITKKTTPAVQSCELSISNLPVFKSELTKNKELRVLGTYNEPWFIGKDIADFLGYKDTKKAIRDHVDKEDKISYREFKKMKVGEMATHDLHPDTILINESGLFSLTLSSKLSSAKEFKRWVTRDILPSIRKTGEYINIELKNQLKNMKEELTVKDEEIKKLHTNHQQLLKKRSRTPYEVGNVIYIISNPSFEGKKFGKSTQNKKETISAFMSRLSTYNTGSPHDYQVEYLIYLEENEHLEDALKISYEKDLCQLNKEWVKDVPTKEIVEFIREYCRLLKIEYKEHVYTSLIENSITEIDYNKPESDNEVESDNEPESDNEKNTEVICEFCKNKYKNLQCVKQHQKKAKFCIEIQKKTKNCEEILVDDSNKLKYINRYKVEQWTKDKKTLLMIYPSLLDVEKKLGIYHHTISSVCTGDAKSAGGYWWKFSTKETVENFDYEKAKNVIIKKVSNKKSVEQWTEDCSRHIQTFESLRDAENKLKISRSKISDICKSTEKKTYGGYWFKFCE